MADQKFSQESVKLVILKNLITNHYSKLNFA